MHFPLDTDTGLTAGSESSWKKGMPLYDGHFASDDETFLQTTKDRIGEIAKRANGEPNAEDRKVLIVFLGHGNKGSGDWRFGLEDAMSADQCLESLDLKDKNKKSRSCSS